MGSVVKDMMKRTPAEPRRLKQSKRPGIYAATDEEGGPGQLRVLRARLERIRAERTRSARQAETEIVIPTPEAAADKSG